MSVVTLTYGEIMQAALVGVMRRVGNIKTGRAERPTYGSGQHQAWTKDVEGACGELAVAKHLGLYWSGNIGDLRAADVGMLQVRTTPASGGRLLLHDRDADFDAYILVRGWAPTLTLVGWLPGHAGKRADWLQELQPGRPCFVVPNDALFPMEQLGAWSVAA